MWKKMESAPEQRVCAPKIEILWRCWPMSISLSPSLNTSSIDRSGDTRDVVFD